MNQPGTLGYNLEQWVIDIHRAGGVIPDSWPIEHHQETDRVEADRTVVRATVGEREWGGSRPWNVAVEVEHIFILTDKATAESYVASTEDVMADPTTVASLALFTDLISIPAEDEQKEASGNVRKRTRTYNFLALEADLIVLPFAPSGDLFFAPSGSLIFA